jgi:hypothetical protein
MLQCYGEIFPDADYRQKESEAVAEGFKAEVCSCGRCLPACVHWVRCNLDKCPMKTKDGKSLLDTLCGPDTSNA